MALGAGSFAWFPAIEKRDQMDGENLMLARAALATRHEPRARRSNIMLPWPTERGEALPQGRVMRTWKVTHSNSQILSDQDQ